MTHDQFDRAVRDHTKEASNQPTPQRNNSDSLTSKFDGSTGEWARKLHIKAGGCAKTAGAARLVL